MAPDPKVPFTFSFDRALETEKDLDLQISAAQERVDKIVNRVQLNDHPIIAMLLSLSHDSGELKQVAKALDRIADILPALDELKAQKAIVDMAKKNPDKFMWMFGSFEHDIDALITDVYKDE